MADKKKPNSADDRPYESDRQFLERSTIGSLMKDVLGKIVSNRPEDPISFLADYFESLEDQSNLVLKARQIIEMTHHSRPVFESNVRMAFDTLMKQRVAVTLLPLQTLIALSGNLDSDTIRADGQINKRISGVTGTTYTDLLKTLCRDIPQPVTNKLLRKLECVEYEAIRFDVFRSAVFTCCVLQDYVKLAELLFQSLDFQRTGKVDKTLCETVNEQLKAALSGVKTDARRIVEAGYNLGPDGLYFALERAMRRDRHGQGVQTQEQFTVELCDAFLSKVKKLK